MTAAARFLVSLCRITHKEYQKVAFRCASGAFYQLCGVC